MTQLDARKKNMRNTITKLQKELDTLESLPEDDPYSDGDIIRVKHHQTNSGTVFSAYIRSEGEWYCTGGSTARFSWSTIISGIISKVKLENIEIVTSLEPIRRSRPN